MLRAALVILVLSVCWCRAGGIQELVFCHYNLENFSDGRPAEAPGRAALKPKKSAAIAAQIQILSEIRPDILGVCEMGSLEKFGEFRRLLRAAGLEYEHWEYLAAADEDRRLALASRFPIVARSSRGDVRFVLNAVEERVRRGILDVTLELPTGYRLRCVGVHLKSKLAAREGDSVIRRMEARKVREHLDAIFAAEPDVNLLCYGDFNDTRNEPAVQEILGIRGSPGAMVELPCRDALGDRWTHYWRPADIYTRIDFLFASRGLLPEVVKEKSGIHRGDDWAVASDHRAIFTTIRPVEHRR
jgi:endonuclease/exonuclease/phosphatase family metal-dependent hydrolase